MKTWDQLLKELSETARREASTAPELMADLAQLERYIAESYHQRTLVELIQNADDAGACAAACVVGSGWILFCNDGRYFTEADFRSICRSGVSLKRSEGGKIGFRGIGFKSTINLSTESRIHVMSGDLAFTFSRELTHEALGVDRVPTIRMPHPLSVSGANRSSIDAAVKDLSAKGYRTFFILESKDVGRAEEELRTLDGESLLFLRKLQNLLLQTGESTRRIGLNRTPKAPGTGISVVDGGRRSSWLLFSHPDDPATSLAFPLNPDDQIDHSFQKPQPAHCFLPTGESSGYPFRVNADFSTDPSRTRIDFDERSKMAINRLAETIIKLMGVLASTENVPPWLSQIFTVVSNPLGFSRLGDKLREAIQLAGHRLDWLPGTARETSELRARPTWLNPNDFARIVPQETEGMRAIVRLDAQCPNLMKFAAEVGVKPLEIQEVVCDVDRLGEMGRVDLIQHMVQNLRVTGSGGAYASFERLPLWMDPKGEWCTVRQAKRGISPRYREILTARLSPAELQWVDSNWALGLDSSITPNLAAESKLDALGGIQTASAALPRAAKVLTRWRKSEENLREVLALRLGAEVRDVSQSNLGYDLEAAYPDGRKDCIEVKELGREGGEFALTNNEYAHATSLGAGYVVAICMQDANGFSWTLIRDPMANLQLTKRCRQWEWVCSDVPRFIEREEF